MKNPFLFLSGVFGFLGVGTGAFGAHGLKSTLTPEMMTIFETGSRYVLIHAVVLVGVALLHQLNPSVYSRAAGWLMVTGMIIFGGTLWALAISGVKILGAITPLGGLCLLAGWICIALAGKSLVHTSIR